MLSATNNSTSMSRNSASRRTPTPCSRNPPRKRKLVVREQAKH